MAATYTIDASVFINAFNPAETGHAHSRRLLAQLRRQAVPLIVPTVALPEVSAAIRRGRGDEQLARCFESLASLDAGVVRHAASPPSQRCSRPA